MIKINTASFIPIYEQIKKQIKSRILLGDLKDNEPLPSIRDLATVLIINPNTVARAYRELEMEGFIYTRRGKGCYVSGDSSTLIERERKKVMNQIFDDAIEEAKKFELNLKEIKRLFEQRLDLSREDNRKGEKNG